MNDTPYWFPLWQLLHQEHKLLLLDDDCVQIAAAVDEVRKDEPLLFVERRPLLTDAALTTRAGRPAILISDTLPPAELAIALWHEVVHLLRSAGGYDQSEADVESAAQGLAKTCPQIVEWVFQSSLEPSKS